VSQAPPLTDAIATSVSRLVADSQSERRDPSHSDLATVFQRSGTAAFDPTAPTGKAKRVRAVLNACLVNDIEAGRDVVRLLISLIQGCGGFRPESSNYVGEEAVANAQMTLAAEGWELSSEGDLRPRSLEGLSGEQMTEALWVYVKRARAGSVDSALLVGTGKDLVEATAAHVLVQRFGAYSETSNFPTLLGQAFGALGLATPADPTVPNEHSRARFERSLYEAGCAVNKMRNKEGTGHGRPFLPDLTDAEARAATQLLAVVSDLMLSAL